MVCFFQGYGNMKMYAYMFFSAFVDSNLLFFSANQYTTYTGWQ